MTRNPRPSRLSVSGLAFVRGFGRGDPRREAVAAAVLLQSTARVKSDRALGRLAGISPSTANRWKKAAVEALRRARHHDGIALASMVSE